MEYSASGERLLEIASQLFYAEGIGAIGVDRVAEESEVSKPTLYAQFKTRRGLSQRFYSAVGKPGSASLPRTWKRCDG